VRRFSDLRNCVGEQKPSLRKQTALGNFPCVDDEEVSCEIVASMLTMAGYQCRTAADGLEALDVLNSGEEFELLLTNLMMPNLDGIGLLERTKEQFPDMPVLVETASPSPRNHQKWCL
jgi:two-component system, cell cycle sensor histidine kinase and response regulator CckA